MKIEKKNITIALSRSDHDFLAEEKKRQGVNSYSRVISNFIKKYRELEQSVSDKHSTVNLPELEERVDSIETVVKFLEKELVKKDVLIEQNAKLVDLLYQKQPTHSSDIEGIRSEIKQLKEQLDIILKLGEKQQADALIRAKNKLKDEY